jgi:hypothetical protein
MLDHRHLLLGNQWPMANGQIKKDKSFFSAALNTFGNSSILKIQTVQLNIPINLHIL